MKDAENKIKNKRCIIAGFFSAKEKDFQLKIDLVNEKVKTLGGFIIDTIIQRRGVSRSKTPGG
ncbi:MAG: hypothetical protein GY749_03595 [Desulfobacteraceae bacterium]|nr:hypothetical protein [Desulfobacteraceae bacterium]